MVALVRQDQLGLFPTGCLDFVMAIKKRLVDLGGELKCGAEVEEVLVEGGRAVGVRLADGSEHRADHVVSAADGYHTVYKLLGGRFTDREIEERHKNWKLCRPMVMVSLGVNREFNDDNWLTVYMLERPIEIGGHSVDLIPLRVFNYGKRFAPEGKTVVQAMFDTEWEHWNDLFQNDRDAYVAEKDRVADEVIDRLERHYPGIKDQIEMTDVATPTTTYRYTLNRDGAYMGWFINPRTITTNMRRTIAGLDNFYMAGQWVLPGGGVPTSLASGKDAVRIICKRDGKNFRVEKPE